MTADELYKEGNALRSRLEVMRLTDLLALNPTLQQMYHISEVMMMGYGKGFKEWDIAEVKNLLNSKVPEIKLLGSLRAEAGKFRVVLIIDSKKYQLGKDQPTTGTAVQLYREYGKNHPGRLYDDKGNFKMEIL